MSHFSVLSLVGLFDMEWLADLFIVLNCGYFYNRPALGNGNLEMKNDKKPFEHNKVLLRIYYYRINGG